MSGSHVVAIDFDGTVVDCATRQTRLAQTIAKEQAPGDPFDGGAFWEKKRSGATTLEALQAIGVPRLLARDIDRAWKARIESPECLAWDWVLHGVEQALVRLKANGFRIHLISARTSPERLRMQMMQLDLDRLFDGVGVVSPSRVVAEKAAWLSRLAPVAFVGDSESDVEAARTAGTSFIGVTCGQRSDEFLRKAGVAVLVASVADAVDLILEYGRTPRPPVFSH